MTVSRPRRPDAPASERRGGVGPHGRARRLLVLPIALGLLVVCGLGLWELVGPVRGADHRALHALISLRRPTLTHVALGLALLARSWVLLPLALLLGALLRGRGVDRWAPSLATSGAIVLQQAVKAIVQRPRPTVPHLETVTGSSFPSGHGTESTAFLLALAMTVSPLCASPRIRGLVAVTAIGLAVAVGASRVYLGVHYPTDVVAGMLLGAAWAVAVLVSSR